MKRRIIACFIAFALCFGTVPIVSARTAQPVVTAEQAGAKAAASREIDTGYLLREDFMGFAVPGVTQGWERVNLSPSAAGVTCLVKSPNDRTESYMKKGFLPQSSGNFTLEFRILLIDDVTSGSIALCAGNRKAIEIGIENNRLTYLAGDDRNLDMMTLNYNSWQGIKLTADMDAKTVSVWANGILLAQDAAFTNSADTVDSVYFGIDRAGIGCYKLGTVNIYRGYAMFEHLISSGTRCDPFDPSRNLCKTGTASATALEGSISNNNGALAKNFIDGDPETYWEHMSEYDADRSTIQIDFGGKVVPVDRVAVTVEADFAGVLNFSYLKTDGSWGLFDYAVNVVLDKGLTYEKTLESPVYLANLALTFHRNEGKPNDLKNNVVKISEFSAYCSKDLGVSVQELPSDFTADKSGGDVWAEEVYGYKNTAEFNAFHFLDESLDKSVSLTKKIALTGDLLFDFRVMFFEKSGGMEIGLAQGTSNELKLMAKNGNLVVQGGGIEAFTVAKNYQEKIWYTVQFRISADGKLKISVNGWSLAADRDVPADWLTAGYTSFFARTGALEQSEFYLDDIRVSNIPARGEVPDLEPADTGDTIITMQACTLWREGSHVGWDAINREEMNGRKPILGWYDEGNPEVADWEIKFARDHGINNFMYCWYRENTGGGSIMKSPYSDQLWEGLFNANFRDDMKFSLMFTNSPEIPGTYSYRDMLDNVMPYFIETFFKNPNYSKTADNKPIFYIYEFQSLINEIGDVNGDGKKNSDDIRILFNDMRRMCVEAGFGGLVIATELRSPNASLVLEAEKCGYDYLFAYTWHPSRANVTNDEMLSMIQSYLVSQRKFAGESGSDLQIIPNISKSWDSTAWTGVGFGGGKSPSYAFDLDHYRRECLWVKDVFGAPVIDSAGNKLVMLDNWNEYGEGHWLFPTYDAPSYKGGQKHYGYLDVLREVFGKGNYAHRDYLPLEEGFGPYDKWYSGGWGQVDDPFGEAGGSSADSSVSEPGFDYVVGKNTTGGNFAVATGGKFQAASANHILVPSGVLANAKAAGEDLVLTMKHGTIRIPTAKIDAGCDLSVVWNQFLDVTDWTAKLRGTSLALRGNAVYEVRFLSGGRPASIVGNLTPKEAGDYIVFRKAPESASSLNIAGTIVYGLKR